MALFMVQNHLTEQAIYDLCERLDFPESVVQFFQGYLGQPPGGFPEIFAKPGDAIETRDLLIELVQ